jgi:hypothetical protein
LNGKIRRLAATAAAPLLFCAIAHAQDDTVVQLKDDPYRRVVFENAVVRVWEVKVPVGESTPFHEHKNDQVSVRINTTVLTNVPKGGLFSFTRDYSLESGSVAFAEYTASPYVHKITPNGNAHHVVEAELLSPPPSGDRRAAVVERPGVSTVLDNHRLRATRVRLEPGKSADVAPYGNTFIVVIKGGAAQPKGLKTADVEWHGERGTRAIRNDGSTPIELVEIQVK